jgi:plastocyanin
VPRRSDDDQPGSRLAALAPWAIACLALAGPGCGGDRSSPVDAKPSPKVTVILEGDEYVPAHVRVPVGGRVTWFAAGQGSYTAETDGVGFFEVDRRKLDRLNRFDIHTVQRGEAESVEFDTPGVYRYYSSFDSSMKGTVEVVEKDG